MATSPYSADGADLSKQFIRQGFVLDGWPKTMADGAALELGLTGLDLEREAAMRIRAPRLVPQSVGTVPDPFRTLTSGGSFLPRVVNQVRASTLFFRPFLKILLPAPHVSLLSVHVRM